MAIKIKRFREEPEKTTEQDETVSPDVLAPGEGPAVPTIPDDKALASDEIYTSTRDLFTWIQDNRVGVFAGVVAAAIVVGFVYSYLTSGEARRAEASEPLYSALYAAGAGVGTEEGDVFAGLTERETAVRDHARRALETTDGRAEALARALEGRALVALGEGAPALEAYRQASGAFEATDAESVILAWSTATAQAAAGDLDGALAALDTLAASYEQYAFPTAIRRAQLVDAYGAPTAALEAYRTVSTRFADETGIDEIRQRIAQLEIELNVEPVVAEAEGSGEAPAGVGN